MRLLRPLILAALASSGCLPDDLVGPEPNCDTRLPFYPDQDGDGVGATSPVFIGCEAPSGYVDVTGDCDDSDPDVVECPDTGDTGDTRDTGDTGDTGVSDDTGEHSSQRG